MHKLHNSALPNVYCNFLKVFLVLILTKPDSLRPKLLHTKDFQNVWIKDYFFQRGCVLDKSSTESENLSAWCLLKRV